MLKKLGVSACALVLSGGLAFAGERMGQTGQAGETGRSVATAPSSLSTQSWLASDIYEQPVYDNAENKIGDVSDLELDSTGTVKSAIIGVGGFLGVGQKDVAIPFSDLKVASKEGKTWLVLDRSKEELQKAPAYQPKRMKNK
jgi:sporulation protein YlmC with PRC-barrel domain